MKPYLVRIPVFEGPFDLLLHLVRKHEISIFDIPVSQITEEYMAYLALLEAFDLEVCSEFLVMAANLIYIKSRMLLPAEEGQPLEEGEEEADPRAELVRRLLEYKRFQDSAKFLDEREVNQRRVFYRALPPEAMERLLGDTSEAEVYVEATLYDLVAAFRRALRGVTPERPSLVVSGEPITVGEKIAELRRHFEIQETFALSAMLRRELPKAHFIATFLAILELARLGIVALFQSEAFGEIRVFRLRDVPAGELALSDYR